MYFNLGTVLSDRVMFAVLDTDSLDVDVLTNAEYQECLRLGFTIYNTNAPMTFRYYKDGTSKIVASKERVNGLDRPVIIVSYIESIAVLAKLDFKLSLQTAIYSFPEPNERVLTLIKFFDHSNEFIWRDLPEIEEPSPDIKAFGNNLFALRNVEYVDDWELGRGDVIGVRNLGMHFKNTMHDLTISSIKVQPLHNKSSLITVTISGWLGGLYIKSSIEKKVVNNYYRQFYYVFDAQAKVFDKCRLTFKTDNANGKLTSLPRFSSNWVLARAMINNSHIKVHKDLSMIGELLDGLHFKLLNDGRKYTLFPESRMGTLTDEERRYWDNLQ